MRKRRSNPLSFFSWTDEKTFIQSFESREVLDSAVLIMPLVFFISPADERLISTIKQILKPPEKGGLTSNGLVFRCISTFIAKIYF